MALACGVPMGAAAQARPTTMTLVLPGGSAPLSWAAGGYAYVTLATLQTAPTAGARTIVRRPAGVAYEPIALRGEATALLPLVAPALITPATLQGDLLRLDADGKVDSDTQFEQALVSRVAVILDYVGKSHCLAEITIVPTQTHPNAAPSPGAPSAEGAKCAILHASLDGTPLNVVPRNDSIVMTQQLVEVRQAGPDGRPIVRKLPGRWEAADVTLRMRLQVASEMTRWFDEASKGRADSRMLEIQLMTQDGTPLLALRTQAGILAVRPVPFDAASPAPASVDVVLYVDPWTIDGKPKP
jgi:hypothetical protein